jgi:Arc/MetJ-type ribon-helix-helix transcriptional regulator
MRAVQVSDEVKDIVDRHVAAGSASSGEEFVEQAVRLYADYLEDDQGALVAAAVEEGREAIRRGEYTTVANQADAAVFWDGVWADATRIAAQLRAGRASDEDGARPHK